MKFAYHMGIVKSNYRFIAVDGEHEATLDMDGTVSLKMNDVENVKVIGSDYILDTGSPHYVLSCNDVNKIDVFKKGREIRYSPQFEKEGINVNFAQQLNPRYQIAVRTYERGVEDETYSCGTGVTAAALVNYHNDNGFNRVEVKTRGGSLSVDYDKVGNSFRNIWLTGPAEKVFEGIIELQEV